MATANSTSARKGTLRKKSAHRKNAAASGPSDRRRPRGINVNEILGRFSDGLALVETAYSALETAQEDETAIGPGVLTLQRGIGELKGVYTDFDLAISRSR